MDQDFQKAGPDDQLLSTLEIIPRIQNIDFEFKKSFIPAGLRPTPSCLCRHRGGRRSGGRSLSSWRPGTCTRSPRAAGATCRRRSGPGRCPGNGPPAGTPPPRTSAPRTPVGKSFMELEFSLVALGLLATTRPELLGGTWNIHSVSTLLVRGSRSVCARPTRGSSPQRRSAAVRRRSALGSPVTAGSLPARSTAARCVSPAGPLRRCSSSIEMTLNTERFPCEPHSGACSSRLAEAARQPAELNAPSPVTNRRHVSNKPRKSSTRRQIGF